MPRGDESSLPPGVPEDRRVLVDRRRLRTLHVARVLGAAASAQPGFLAIRAVDQDDAPAQVMLPVEAAMALLNELQRLSDEDGWFDVDRTPTP